MTLELRPAYEFDLATLADLFTRGFEGYFVRIVETPEGLAARVRYDTIDLALSWVALLDDRPVGIVCVAVRGWQCRIAGMGVVSDARRHGVGRGMMEEAIKRCRAAGLGKMVLEVIEQNEPAAALYRGLGFTTGRRLVGYRLAANALPATDSSRRDAAALVPVDPREVGRQIAREADPDLPWQLAAETLGVRGPDLTGHSLHGNAFALTSEADDAVVVEALLVPRRERRSGWGSRLARALAAQYEGRALRLPARVPNELAAPFFAGLGFEQGPITQREMRLDL